MTACVGRWVDKRRPLAWFEPRPCVEIADELTDDEIREIRRRFTRPFDWAISAPELSEEGDGR